MQSTRTRKLTVTAVLAAICIILAVTPIGILPIPPLGVAIMHIPVIVGAIMEGLGTGLALGAIFGVASIYRAYVTALPTSVLFMDPLIAVFPRLLIPIVAYYSYVGLKKLFRGKEKLDVVSIACASVLGSLTNTVGVLSMIYLIYAKEFAQLMEVPVEAIGNTIIGFGVVQGLPEAAGCAIVSIAVIKGLGIIKKTRSKKAGKAS